MPIQVHCDCGRSGQVKDELAGRRLRCKGCCRVLPIPLLEAEEVEEEAESYHLSEVDELTSRKVEPAGVADRSRRSEGIRSERPRLSERPRKRRWQPRPGPSTDSGWSIINGQVAVGLLMMAGATLRFVLGLALGYIFFYPPILFCLGGGTLFRGITNRA